MSVTVYYTVDNGWWIGPLWSWKVGDVVEVPDREPRFKEPRPGGRGEVKQIDQRDGMAYAARLPDEAVAHPVEAPHLEEVPLPW